ncbi:MAG: DUF1801 domain-containing protein [Saprospiraceae bacterium]|nr:DUF1801 domain-containing protein [Saprospiraceae bacterium]
MQYNVSSPTEYLDTIDKDWRYDKIMEIREMIRDIYPEIVEGIEYKMLSYRDNAGSIFHLNAQKNHVGLYFGDIQKIDPDGELLKGLNLGKGCIRISKSKNIPETGIREFITKAVALWKEGKDISC